MKAAVPGFTRDEAGCAQAGRMTRPRIPVLSVLLMAALCAAPAGAMGWLESQRWERRLVLVTGAADAPELEALQARLEASADALQERHLSVWRLERDRLRWVGGAPPLSGRGPGASDADRVRRLLRTNGSFFGLHLVGLDGEYKARSADVAGLDDLLEQVDAMPMRRQELRRAPQSRDD